MVKSGLFIAFASLAALVSVSTPAMAETWAHKHPPLGYKTVKKCAKMMFSLKIPKCVQKLAYRNKGLASPSALPYILNLLETIIQFFRSL